MKRQQTVWVRNNGTERFVDKYDNEDFEILPGQAVEMLVECAELCLGFGQEDKTRALRRKGWAFTNIGMKEALAKLEAFSFHMSEKEALEHGTKQNKAPAKPADPAEVHSSAPVVGGAAAGVSSDAPAEAAVHPKPARKPGPLEKLAAANAAAG